jgi:hypothetical protein
MNDPENFISRWSRRKREAGDEKSQPKNTNTAQAVRPAAAEDANVRSPEVAAATSPMPELDAASLPPIESIKAGSDISAFMRSGVPSALRHAALRRAWSVDPAIRDFKGPNENFWDVAGPDGVAGFGDLNPNLDLKRMVSELFGKNASEKAGTDSANNSDTPSNASGAEVGNARTAETHLNTNTADHSHRTEIAATQNQPLQNRSEQKPVRRHGSALPE